MYAGSRRSSGWAVSQMIIFDTNILRGVTRNNPKFDLLRALRRSGLHSAVIPWMVLEELAAKQVLDYATSHQAATATINDLNRKMPWGTAVTLPALEFERAKEYWRSQYAEVLEILDTSDENAKAALAREAYCEKPAKTNPEEKGGARDVAIWLSVIDYLKAHPGEEVFFVSTNTRDFGKGEDYPEPMASDLGEMKHRLTIMTSFGEFLSRFTETIEVGDEDIRRLLEDLVSDPVIAIETSASTWLKDGRFEGTRIDNGRFEAFQWRAWLLPPSAVVRNATRGSGHKIGDAEWYTATVDWILVGIAQPVMSIFNTQQADISAIAETACQWRTKVLFSIGDDLELTIVEYERPEALDPNDRTALQPLLDRATSASAHQSSAVFGAFVAALIEGRMAADVYPDVMHGAAEPD